jgi:hypothetical protein
MTNWKVAVVISWTRQPHIFLEKLRNTTRNLSIARVSTDIPEGHYRIQI